VDRLFRHPLVWIAVVATGVASLVITFAYVGAFVDPIGRLDRLPIGVVDQDQPQAIAGQQVAVGADFVHQLKQQNRAPGPHPVEFVQFRSSAGALAALSNDHLIGVIVLPPTLSKDVGAIGTALGAAPPATVQLYRNVGSGSLQPEVFDDAATAAIDTLSATASGQLTDALMSAGQSVQPANVVSLANPVVAVSTDAPPLGEKAGRGLPPYYVALMITLTGLIGMTAIHLAVASLTGREHLEVLGRRVELRRVELDRRRQFLAEAVLALPIALVGGPAVVWMAVGLLGAESDHPKQAALFAIAGVLAMSLLTLAFLTAFGLVGDLLAVVVIVVFGVPSARGVYPSEALPAFFVALGRFLPLRWLTDGMRSMFFFAGRADAGLRGAWIAIGLYAVIALGLGYVVARWSDRRSRSTGLATA
jgi:YhgE/Pip-like protein